MLLAATTASADGTASCKSDSTLADYNQPNCCEETEQQPCNDLEGIKKVRELTEMFCTYFKEGNLQAIRDMLSLNAGFNTYSRNKGVRYPEPDLMDYCITVEKVFSRDSVNVKFDHVSVRPSSTNSDYFGTTLHLSWTSSSGYCDKGWIFLLWDLSNPDKPKIPVRTWQPDEIITSEDQVLGFPDFFIPSR